jgi:hypothetical protein
LVSLKLAKKTLSSPPDIVGRKFIGCIHDDATVNSSVLVPDIVGRKFIGCIGQADTVGAEEATILTSLVANSSVVSSGSKEQTSE